MAALSEDDAFVLHSLQNMAVQAYIESEHPRMYMKPIFAQRREQGDYYNLVKELELADIEFYNYARMTPALLKEIFCW